MYLVKKQPLTISQDLATAVTAIINGGVVAFPTDTVYCLAASINKPEAVERIFSIKGREATKALPVLVSDIQQIRQIAEVSVLAEKLIRQFMPGALTLILKKNNSVSDIVTGGSNNVAVRIPGNGIARKIIDSVGAPVTGTSANLSGRGSVCSAIEVNKQLGEKLDVIIDNGNYPISGTESTIIDVTIDPIRIIREGAISVYEIESFLLGK